MMEDRTLFYRRLFGRFATGVAVILAEDADKLVGLTVNSLTSASLDPLLLLFCARNESQSTAAFLRSGRFSVNVLAAHQESIARHFSGSRDRDLKLECVRAEGFAWLPGSNAVFRCEVEAAYPGGDHRIILGRVIDVLGPEDCDRPLLYHEGRYVHLEKETEGRALETKQP
jgi:3-hydroxy-9,10-secoandrosta-1,3,5(10)-triene-9,17-dione monooxygenase reductase component